MQQDRFRFRLYKDRLFKAAVILFSFSSALPLLFILFYIFKNGIAVINWQFLTNLPKPVGEPGGGISNAIVGTLYAAERFLRAGYPPGDMRGNLSF